MTLGNLGIMQGDVRPVNHRDGRIGLLRIDAQHSYFRVKTVKCEDEHQE